MAWVRLDDQFFFHAKVLDISDGACLLYLIALTQCNAALTDGRLTPARLRVCAAARGLADAPALAAELVGAGLWERTRGGWCIHNYGRYQPSAVAVKKRRESAAQRQAEKREKNRGDHLAVAAAPEAETSPLDYVESHAVTPREHRANGARAERESDAGRGTHESHGAFADPVPSPIPTSSSDEEESPPRDPPVQLRRAVPKPGERERAETAADPLFESLVAAVGEPVGETAWADVRKALKDLRQAGATPGDIAMRAENYKLIMGVDRTGHAIVLSAPALVKHWGKCAYAPIIEPAEEEDREAGAVAWARRYGLIADRPAERGG